ncbi:hypothetical protein TacPo2_46 [Pantoea bacteriophage TacPo2]
MSALNTMVGGSHYQAEGGIQPIQFYHANPHLNFQQCNMIKYAFRHKDKNGLQDLLKVVHYAMLEAEFQYPKEDVEKWKLQVANLIDPPAF